MKYTDLTKRILESETIISNRFKSLIHRIFVLDLEGEKLERIIYIRAVFDAKDFRGEIFYLRLTEYRYLIVTLNRRERIYKGIRAYIYYKNINLFNIVFSGLIRRFRPELIK